MNYCFEKRGYMNHEYAKIDQNKTRRDEYRGNPLLVLPLGENREFSFGPGKAKAILKFIDDIKAFAAEFEPPKA